MTLPLSLRHTPEYVLSGDGKRWLLKEPQPTPAWQIVGWALKLGSAGLVVYGVLAVVNAVIEQGWLA